jgi:hypothetical protein
MRIAAFLLLILVGCYLAQTVDAASAQGAEPQLTIRQEGDDLVVSMSMQVNNSPHVLVTGYRQAGREYRLYYLVIHNADRARRSLKQIGIAWRLKRVKKEEATCRAAGQVLSLPEAELKQLQEQWPGLLEKP